jgi:O-acetyl-ADP-ribose deacetylase
VLPQAIGIPIRGHRCNYTAVIFPPEGALAQGGPLKIAALRADITGVAVDAIVNAANTGLRRGGGVCAAIHDAAGPDLEAECLEIGGCETGDAKVTSGYGLPARWVIHAVGPTWQGGDQDEAVALASAYRRSLAVADEVGARSVAFPAISTGIYGFPADQAATIAVDAVRTARTDVEEVILVAFDQETHDRYERLLNT